MFLARVRIYNIAGVSTTHVARWVLSAVVPIYRVSKLLGHRKVALTVDTYDLLFPQPTDADEMAHST